LSVTTGIGPTDAVGKTTNYEYDKDGRLLKVTDALGQVVSESLYEKNGLLKQTTAGGVLTTFKYDAVNRMFERCVDPDGLNLLCTYQFDALDRQSIVTEKQGAAAVRVTQSFYDRKGQLTRTTVDPKASSWSPTLSMTGWATPSQ